MRLRPAEDLAALSPDNLAEELVQLATEVRDATIDGQSVNVLECLDVLQRASRKAAGPQLALLEVASALLKALTRANFGRPELAAHQALSDHGVEAESFLERALRGAVPNAEVEKQAAGLRQTVRKLVDQGVLRQAVGQIDVAPRFREFVADMLEPPPLRFWREVTDVRNEIMAQRLPENQAASLLAGQFGIGEEQAIRHLRRHPPTEWLSTRPMARRYQRPPIRSQAAPPVGEVQPLDKTAPTFEQPGERSNRPEEIQWAIGGVSFDDRPRVLQ